MQYIACLIIYEYFLLSAIKYYDHKIISENLLVQARYFAVKKSIDI